MLAEERNRELTSIGPNTKMGRLLRRYWYPVAVATDVAQFPKQVRILGENLALYRDRSGRYGLLDESCPHRGASLAYGISDDRGLRCAYHGWLFDAKGQCLEQPAESPTSSFHERIRIAAYPVREMGGMLWAYLGPEPVPVLPRYDIFVWNGVFRDIGHAMLPFSWLQSMENSLDPHHGEWLHRRYGRFVRERRGLQVADRQEERRPVKIGFDLFEHGIITRRVFEGGSEQDDDWKIGKPLLFPFMVREGGGQWDQMRIRVPVDDTHTWFVVYTAHHPGGMIHGRQARIPSYELPWMDRRGRHIMDYVESQDIMAWVTQGPVADRSKEHLGASDAGIIALRKLFFDQMEVVEDGADPLGVIREERPIIEVPCRESPLGEAGTSRMNWLRTASHRFSPAIDQIEGLYERAARPAGAADQLRRVLSPRRLRAARRKVVRALRRRVRSFARGGGPAGGRGVPL